jgi:hypothetical protein
MVKNNNRKKMKRVKIIIINKKWNSEHDRSRLFVNERKRSATNPTESTVLIVLHSLRVGVRL